MSTVCRDCYAYSDIDNAACSNCGSGRLVRHERLDDCSIAHIDCDAFFAALEKRDHPELIDKPVIVGGGRRGVVATCCYIARLNGVRSAMPMFQALKACPEAIVMPPRREVYSKASAEIKDKLLALTPQVQMMSIDEAYLDLNGTETVHAAKPAQVLSRLASEVRQDIGITISIGLSDNKFLAKTASEIDKPIGFAALHSSEAKAFFAPKSISDLHGVGAKMADRLARDNFRTIADLQAKPREELIRRYGESGKFLFDRIRGIDNRPVQTGADRKSVSAERTFDRDIGGLKALEDWLWIVCDDTSRRAKLGDYEGSTITLKLKTNAFKTISRSTSLLAPTQLAQVLFRTALPLLQKEVQTGNTYRLIGIGLSNLSPARGDFQDLVDPTIGKRAKAERASDLARNKFGKHAVTTGRAIRSERPKK